MPSPIGHSAVAILLWPALAGRSRDAPPVRLSSVRGVVLLGGLVFMLTAPDLDFIPYLLLDREAVNPLFQHGGATHSLVAGVVAAVLFASVFRALTSLSWARLFTIGLIAWWSHILMDFFTWQGGVMALWPLTEQRFSSPVPLFYGARHSEPLAFHLHFITLTTELLFALILWFVARARRMKRAAHEPRCTEFPRGRAPAAMEM